MVNTGATRSGTLPVVLASGNLKSTEKAMELILGGHDPLDAVIEGVGVAESDPKDQSVGYGGLPNEEGVVEVDACVMHGPSHGAGAVAALQNTIRASRVARLVMDRTDHVMLVGEGALNFARAHGYGRDEMLTEESRNAWLDWKEKHSHEDMWLPPSDVPKGADAGSRDQIPFTYGTIHCGAVDSSGNVYGATTTSGRSYKLAGRVGDSPIIGAGCYVDNQVGVAGSTGRGEAVITDCGAFAVIERMRTGRTPTEACLDVLQRIVDHNRRPHLRRDDGRPVFQVHMYALSKEGRFGAAAIWSGGTFAVCSGGRNRLEKCAYLFKQPEKAA